MTLFQEVFEIPRTCPERERKYELFLTRFKFYSLHLRQLKFLHMLMNNNTDYLQLLNQINLWLLDLLVVVLVDFIYLLLIRM